MYVYNIVWLVCLVLKENQLWTMSNWRLSPLLSAVVIIMQLSIAKEIIVPMCNDGNKAPEIDDLTPTDLLRIKSLEQLHILSRHGSRVGDHSVASIFPKLDKSQQKDIKWECNFTTVTARDYDDYNWISLQKNYVQNEQITGGNCKDSQSIYKAVKQHKLNAHLIREYYIGDENYNLITKDEFQEIIADIFITNKYKDNNSPFIKIISTDLGMNIYIVSQIGYLTVFPLQNLNRTMLYLSISIYDTFIGNRIWHF